MAHYAPDTYTVYATVGGKRHELSVTVRNFGDCEVHVLQSMTSYTIATWARVYLAIADGSWEIQPFQTKEYKQWKSACEHVGITQPVDREAHVTVWNKAWQNGIGITVHSWDNGEAALDAANGMIGGLTSLSKFAKSFFIDKLEYAPFPKIIDNEAESPQQQAIPAKRKDFGDSADEIAHDDTMPQNDAKRPFRYFKPIAPSVIQLQEFKRGGGGDTYVKAAKEATTPYHKDAIQYDEGDLIYYPITQPLHIQDGRYGKQLVVKTSFGIIWIDKEYEGKDRADWAHVIESLYNQYDRLLANPNETLDATECALVMKIGKTGETSKGTPIQYKNFYKIYQPYREE